jgi:hypothetical protein
MRPSIPTVGNAIVVMIEMGAGRAMLPIAMSAVPMVRAFQVNRVGMHVNWCRMRIASVRWRINRGWLYINRGWLHINWARMNVYRRRLYIHSGDAYMDVHTGTSHCGRRRQHKTGTGNQARYNAKKCFHDCSPLITTSLNIKVVSGSTKNR